MSHKIVMVKPGSHYYGTTVPFDKSVNDIIKLLRKHGCSKIAPIEQAGDPPLHTLFFEKDMMPYLIEFPLTYVEKHETNQFSRMVKTLHMQISGRVIHDRIKALLIEVEYGIYGFDEVMLPHLLVRDNSGQNKALSEFMIENRNRIATGTVFAAAQTLMLTGDKR